MVRCGVKFGLYKTAPSGSNATRKKLKKNAVCRRRSRLSKKSREVSEGSQAL